MRKTRYLKRFDFGANRKNIAGFPLCQECQGFEKFYQNVRKIVEFLVSGIFYDVLSEGIP